MTSEDGKHPPLGDTGASKVLRIGASIPGAVPFAGPTIQAVLTEVLPNIRADRVEVYIRYLQTQIDELNLRLGLETNEGLDLFEEGLWQSARAFTDQRRQYIAQLVASGIAAADEKQQMSRHFLRLLNQLADEDIAVLISQERGELSEFQDGITLARQRLLASFGLLVITRSDLGSIGNSRLEGAKDAYAITEIGREFLECLGMGQ